VVVLRSQLPAPPAPQAGQASYAFPPQQYPGGLLVVRHWVLGGTDGSLLTETLTASSATGRASRVPCEEAIPAVIAATVQTVHSAT
jgi:hypothetical protein